MSIAEKANKKDFPIPRSLEMEKTKELIPTSTVMSER